MNKCDIFRQNISLLFTFIILAILALGFMMSNSKVLAQGPNFNFSNITGNLSMNLSSLLSSFKSVHGAYNNPDFGFEIILPDGWQGSEYASPNGKIVFVGSPDLGIETSSFGAMSISFLNNRNIAALSSFSNLTNPLGVDPSSTGGTTDSQCKPTSFTPVTINGIKAESTDLQCVNNYFGTGENFSARAKSVAFVTSDDSLISVLLIASPGIYERDLAKFEDSVKTVKLSKPGDISLSPTYRTYKEVLNQLKNE